MSDSHLDNTIKMLERTAKRNRDGELAAAYSCSSMFSEDSMASFYCEQEIDSMEEDYDGERFLHPLYEDLVFEQARRKYNNLIEESRRKQHSEILDECVVGGCDKYGSIG
jgi:hypothetical protein